ncbi:hypothetical protein UY3_13115 [Chelonia mydas]|uniref:Uncharacterized protein n=1 Tax=Chelonia mydas TaxID=8469 RepID=M7AW91_CHEMY|nr:hypothetical protein UY3_13115 [Chelonia mydas]
MVHGLMRLQANGPDPVTGFRGSYKAYGEFQWCNGLCPGMYVSSLKVEIAPEEFMCYCSLLLSDLPDTHVTSIQSIQNTAAKNIFQAFSSGTWMSASLIPFYFTTSH